MKNEWKTLFRTGIALLCLWLIIHYWSSAMQLCASALQAAGPLILGAMTAYVINLPMRFFERLFTPRWPKKIHKLKRPLCLLLACICLLAAVTILVRTILPELIDCVTVLVNRLPGAIKSAAQMLDERGITTGLAQSIEENGVLSSLNRMLVESGLITESGEVVSADLDETLGHLLNYMRGHVGGVIGAVVSTTTTAVSGVITFFISIIFTFYLLLGKERIGRQFHRLAASFFPEKAIARLHHGRVTLDECFHSYIVGQCTEAIILGVLCAAGMLIFRFPYALMIGSLVGCTALIPIAGAYIGAAVGAVMIFTVDPMKALWFLVFLIILQQLEGDLIFPKVVGQSIGLPGIWVLAAVTVFGGLFGIGGMVIGVPLTATVYRLLKEHAEKHEAPSASPPASPAPPKAKAVKK